MRILPLQTRQHSCSTLPSFFDEFDSIALKRGHDNTGSLTTSSIKIGWIFLKLLSRKLPLASDVDLDAVAHMTEGFSGADLQALLSNAQLQAVNDLLDSSEGGQHGKKPIITNSLLKSIASKARPSASDAEKRRLHRNSFHPSNSVISPQKQELCISNQNFDWGF
ncbi:hypothetical protein NL676_023806 [Syzygium grande]|nr:hypothetical protein NL676_023806 [Syzygium grande]